MSAIETTSGVQDVVEHVATVTALPTRAPARRVNRSAVAEVLQPPDLWSENRPSLRDLWLYGAYGRWAAVDGAVRFLGAAYATVVVLPVHAAGYLVLWIVERSARLVIAAVLVALVLLAF